MTPQYRKKCPLVVHFNVPDDWFAKKTRSIKIDTLKAAKKLVGVAVYWEGSYNVVCQDL